MYERQTTWVHRIMGGRLPRRSGQALALNRLTERENSLWGGEMQAPKVNLTRSRVLLGRISSLQTTQVARTLGKEGTGKILKGPVCLEIRDLNRNFKVGVP